ncbi:hypothetical protein [Ureibacillus chungkukjangi]|nr:hypothetical protein [Ureibacillus chungkukjangi]
MLWRITIIVNKGGNLPKEYSVLYLELVMNVCNVKEVVTFCNLTEQCN